MEIQISNLVINLIIFICLWAFLGIISIVLFLVRKDSVESSLYFLNFLDSFGYPKSKKSKIVGFFYLPIVIPSHLKAIFKQYFDVSK